MPGILVSGNVLAVGQASALQAKLIGDPAILFTIHGPFAGAQVVFQVSDDTNPTTNNWYNLAVYDLIGQQFVSQGPASPISLTDNLGVGTPPVYQNNPVYMLWPVLTFNFARVWCPQLTTGPLPVKIESFSGPLPINQSVVVGGLLNLTQILLLEAQRIRIGIGLLTDNDLTQVVPASGTGY